MTAFYSKSTNGLYHSDSYDSTAPELGLVPSDSIVIPDDEYSTLIVGIVQGELLHFDGSTFSLLPALVPPLQATPYQFRAGLTKAGIRAQVESAVSASTDQGVKDAYQYASVFIETDPFITEMAASLNLTLEQVHAIFESMQGLAA